MFNDEHHEMHLAGHHPSGAEEWFCPTCGRRFLLQWPPTYKKIILEPGNEQATHKGSKRRVWTDKASANPSQSGHLLAGVDPSEFDPIEITDELRPWVNWIQQAGLGDHWGTPLS